MVVQEQQFSAVESVLWRNAGPNVNLLQEALLKSDKMCQTVVVVTALGYERFEQPLYQLAKN